MTLRQGLIAAACAFAAPAAAYAGGLTGDYNTGPSRVEEAKGASLNIRFHPCKDDKAAVCASVLEMIEPAGPSGRTTLPNGEPVVGAVMIRKLTLKRENEYRDGEILAIDESIVKGKMLWYGLKIDQKPDGTLAATGCLGFICPRKMVWTPAAAGAPAP
jgi:hypothetical protein